MDVDLPGQCETSIADVKKENGEHVIQQLSDKQSSGYESEREMELLSDVYRSQESMISEGTEIQETQPAHVVSRDVAMEYKSGMRVYPKLEKQDDVSDMADCLTVDTNYNESSEFCSPSRSRRFSQIHFCSGKPYPHSRQERSKDDTDLFVRKERGILTTSRGRDLKMMQTDFHKKRPHLWKHSYDRLSGFRDDRGFSIFSDNSTKSSHSQYKSSIKSHDSSSQDAAALERLQVDSCATSETKQTVPVVTVDAVDSQSVSDTFHTCGDSGEDSLCSTVRHQSFKKYLQHRYLSSLRDLHSSEDLTENRNDVREGSVEREILNSPNFSSDIFTKKSPIFIAVKRPEEDDGNDSDDVYTEESGDVNRDDNEVFFSTDIKQQSLAQRLARQRLSAISHEHPVNVVTHCSICRVSSSQSLNSLSHSPDPHCDSLHHYAQHSPHLSPTMPYQRKIPVYYSPKQDHLSPRSPLWSVHEGQIYSFSVPNSPFEARPHSDPEFISSGYSPAFSPDSPIHFTFPSKSMDTNINSRSHHVPPSKVHDSKSSKPLTKLFRSPPAAEQLLSSDNHISGERTYLCPICAQTFASYDSVAKHMAKHLPTETVKSADNNKVHYCRVCERAFSRSDMLTRHMRLHTGLKPYECRICGQVFSRSDHLNTHQRTHTGIKPYRCPQCPYAACRRDMITRHMRIHYKRTGKRKEGSPDDNTDSPGFLSIHDGAGSETCKNSKLTNESFKSQTYSVSSVDSLESDVCSRTHSITSLDSVEYDTHLSQFQRSSADSTDEGIGGVHLLTRATPDTACLNITAHHPLSVQSYKYSDKISEPPSPSGAAISQQEQS